MRGDEGVDPTKEELKLAGYDCCQEGWPSYPTQTRGETRVTPTEDGRGMMTVVDVVVVVVVVVVVDVLVVVVVVAEAVVEVVVGGGGG